MPNVVSQIVGPLDILGGVNIGKVGIFIQASNGNTVTIYRAQILAQFTAATGTVAQKKAVAVLFIQTTIQTALGPEMVPAATITTDFATADGSPTSLQIG